LPVGGFGAVSLRSLGGPEPLHRAIIAGLNMPGSRNCDATRRCVGQ